MPSVMTEQNNELSASACIAVTALTARTTVLILLFVLNLMFVGSAMADGDIQAGKDQSVTCAACHGQDGNSINPEWPSLAGQHEKYLLTALNSFKDSSRQNVLMTSQATGLDEQTMNDLAAYYASQTASRRTTDPALVSQGERLYRGGNLERGVSACIACHGPSGRGNLGAGYPSLTSQHSVYTANQLKAYRSNTRQTDSDRIMRDIAGLMTDDEILAVASYIQGLN
jgi:cytochrome c553